MSTIEQCSNQSNYSHFDNSWKFYDIKDWKHSHQDDSPNPQYLIQDGKLTLFTRANSRDRQKMRTISNHFTSGTYTWKAKIPEIITSEQVSIGCFIYCDDHHELDFEIGYGKETKRAEIKVAPDELIAYMTCQDFPFVSGCAPIKPGWHDFAIQLDLEDGKYVASWIIDGQLKQKKKLEFGTEISFIIFCSVENLKFIGDEIPKNDTYGIFDCVSFNGQIKK